MSEYLITRIEKRSPREKRIYIYMNGEPAFSIHEDVFVKHHLSKGMMIDQEQIENILKAEEENRIRQSALRYLSYRSRTVREVRDHLLQKQYDQDQVDRILNELQKLDYVNDQRYAHQWIDERRKRKGYGKKRLRQELLRKGIQESLIMTAMKDMDEEEERQLAIEVAMRRYLRIHQEEWLRIERRLGSYLTRRGFSHEIVFSVLNYIRNQHQEEG